MQRYSPANPFLPEGFIVPQPQGGAAPMVEYGDARLGDSSDRRRTFGNVYQQPLMPWSTGPMWSTSTTVSGATTTTPTVRLGDCYDRRQTFGNVYTQPLVPRGVPTGPGLGLYYGDPAGLHRAGV